MESVPVARRPHRYLAAVLVAGVVLAGCGDDGPPPNIGAGLEPGDCLDWDGDLRRAEAVETVDCNGPHDGEVYATTELEGDAYPGVFELGAQADARCQTEWEPAIGSVYLLQVEFDFRRIMPTEEQWDGGDRLLTCVLVDSGGSRMLLPYLDG